jgi:nicotinate-nucleotide adenylyltransferase
MRPLGIFGGTFDPIHNGHLRTAFELAESLELERVLFIPAGDPPHRPSPRVPATLRLELVRAAIADEPRFALDGREVMRGGRSYTVLTLEELRAERGGQPLVLCMGMDAFLGLQTWHRWTELTRLAHLAVAHRPGFARPADGPLGELIDARRATSPAELAAAPAGCVFFHAGTQVELSATELRSVLESGQDPRYLMPEPVRRMILDTGAYARPGENEG